MLFNINHILINWTDWAGSGINRATWNVVKLTRSAVTFVFPLWLFLPVDQKTTQVMHTTYPIHEQFAHFSPHWELHFCRKIYIMTPKYIAKKFATAAPGHMPSMNLAYYCLTLVSVSSIVATWTTLVHVCVLYQCGWYASLLAKPPAAALHKNTHNLQSPTLPSDKGLTHQLQIDKYLFQVLPLTPDRAQQFL